jgi:hypothetical protein
MRVETYVVRRRNFFPEVFSNNWYFLCNLSVPRLPMTRTPNIPPRYRFVLSGRPRRRRGRRIRQLLRRVLSSDHCVQIVSQIFDTIESIQPMLQLRLFRKTVNRSVAPMRWFAILEIVDSTRKLDIQSCCLLGRESHDVWLNLVSAYTASASRFLLQAQEGVVLGSIGRYVGLVANMAFGWCNTSGGVVLNAQMKSAGCSAKMHAGEKSYITTCVVHLEGKEMWCDLN